MPLPGLIVTGSSGFVGRNLLPALLDTYRVYGIARRSPGRSGAPTHPNLTWFQADIGERRQLEAVFAAIAAEGGAETVVHLAARHDLTGRDESECWRTNVVGLRHVLELSVPLRVRHFLFSSAVGACRIPRAGAAITEDTPPHGKTAYAWTKREGEAMMFEFADRLRPVIIRFGALFSDWCEHPALFAWLNAWLSRAWNHRVLVGQGRSAVPYLHVNDAVLFVLEVLARLDSLSPCEVLLASPDDPVSHETLHAAATLAYRGERGRPVRVPMALWGAAMSARDLSGRLKGEPPIERPWMADAVDAVMNVDASRTRHRLEWAPRPRLEIIRRLPFLVENLKTDPFTWADRNRAGRKHVEVPDYLKVHWLIEQHQEAIVRQFQDLIASPSGRERFARYRDVTVGQLEWSTRLVLRALLNSIRAQDRGAFMGYCRDLAVQRLKEGFVANELCGALEGLNLVCWRVLRRDPESKGLRQVLLDYVTSTLRAGCDQAHEVFEQEEARLRRARARAESRVES